MFLYQPQDGYCYNSDSIFLYQFIASFSPKGSMLDVGSGVGILSLLLTRDFGLKTTIIDKQPHLLEYAKHNFFLNRLEAQLLEGDFLELKTSERFDVIVSNPPFYDPAVTQSEHSVLNIARYAHHLPLELFVAKVKSLLKPRGWFYFCYDAKQVDRVCAALLDKGIKAQKIRFVYSKADRPSKLVFIAARNNSKSMCDILPPLIVFDSKSNYNSEAKAAFDRANTHSIKAKMECK